MAIYRSVSPPLELINQSSLQLEIIISAGWFRFCTRRPNYYSFLVYLGARQTVATINAPNISLSNLKYCRELAVIYLNVETVLVDTDAIAMPITTIIDCDMRTFW